MINHESDTPENNSELEKIVSPDYAPSKKRIGKRIKEFVKNRKKTSIALTIGTIGLLATVASNNNLLSKIYTDRCKAVVQLSDYIPIWEYRPRPHQIVIFFGDNSYSVGADYNKIEGLKFIHSKIPIQKGNNGYMTGQLQNKVHH